MSKLKMGWKNSSVQRYWVQFLEMQTRKERKNLHVVCIPPSLSLFIIDPLPTSVAVFLYHSAHTTPHSLDVYWRTEDMDLSEELHIKTAFGWRPCREGLERRKKESLTQQGRELVVSLWLLVVMQEVLRGSKDIADTRDMEKEGPMSLCASWSDRK